ncbi:pyridoxamine 5'-phosphate oxidase family protein [Eikenella sp. HMSC061C02]|uniref:pyridoxamine 5'-phosphate oxidase family protein n=1 Tax=Eikenella sp. HMSC061C02 TaxID=1715021 RepID=UPI000AB1C65F|nr:pyridoxamine 5'-phosphate oxidase family protein [Eikenella sp. HMSC061C02]
MPPLPANIHAFLTEHHVVSLAACHEGELWSASCFYVLDPVDARLIVLTGKNTQHGRLMLHNPHIAGTIAGQPARIRDICGIQFAARAECIATLPNAAPHSISTPKPTPSPKFFPAIFGSSSLITSNTPVTAPSSPTKPIGGAMKKTANPILNQPNIFR